VCQVSRHAGRQKKTDLPVQPVERRLQQPRRRDLRPLAGLAGEHNHVDEIAGAGQAQGPREPLQAIEAPHGQERPLPLRDNHVAVQVEQLPLAAVLPEGALQSVRVDHLGEGAAQVLDPGRLLSVRRVPLV
jgi:hypothetical protein